MRLLLFFSPLLIAGCTKPEVEACRADLLGTLKSPSSYKEIKVSSVDEGPMTPAQFYERAGLGKPVDQDERIGDTLRRREMQGHETGLRIVYIEYDAQNGFGAVMRGAKECGFLTIDGDAVNIQTGLGAASLRRAQEMMNELKGRTDPKAKPRFGCCI